MLLDPACSARALIRRTAGTSGGAAMPDGASPRAPARSCEPCGGQSAATVSSGAMARRGFVGATTCSSQRLSFPAQACQLLIFQANPSFLFADILQMQLLEPLPLVQQQLPAALVREEIDDAIECLAGTVGVQRAQAQMARLRESDRIFPSFRPATSIFPIRYHRPRAPGLASA